MDCLDAGAFALPGLEARLVERCGSTNEVLLREGKGAVLLAAEEQTAGRGRRGRRWHCAPGAGVTFSLAAQTRRPLRELPGLSLVAGVAAARALRALGVERASLKWPNDLVVDGAKLGGILVESRGSNAGALAVIGIGVNCRRDASLARRVRRAVASLDNFIAVDRNRVIASIAAELLAALKVFEAHGLEPLRAAWESLDAHAGERLRVRLGDGRVLTGLARGLDADGGLRLQTRSGLQAVHSGRVVSARPA